MTDRDRRQLLDAIAALTRVDCIDEHEEVECARLAVALSDFIARNDVREEAVALPY